MGTIWVREFTGGLDTRRMPVTTAGGVLITASDGHLTRGGDFEKRAAFVPAYSLPAGVTKGLTATAAGLTVFGSDPAPALPSGVVYQRLQHPGGSPLSRVLSEDLYAGKIYAVGEFDDASIHHFYDGVRVADWFDGRARLQMRVTGGNSASTLDTLRVNGVSIIAAPIAWATSHSATAAAIAAAINSFASVPEYTATSDGDAVNIIASTTGTGPNGLAVTYTVSGGLALTPASGTALSGGVASTTGFVPGAFVKTIGSKVYSTSGPNMHFSGIKAPTKWLTGTVGAGFIDMSSETSGSEQLIALAKYQNYVAVFAEQVIQIWYVDPDPDLNKQAQVLNNTGTASPRSVTQFGDADLFYLNESGLRSLRARDSSNAAATEDIGVPIDALVTAALRQLTDAQRAEISGAIEPQEGRFWLAIQDKIFVFSYFSGAKVSAWSTYSPGFIVERLVAKNRKMFVRSGDTIYAYGGLGAELQYDATVAVATTPYLDAETPTKKKELEGFDAAVEGLWEVSIGMDPNELAVADVIGTVDRTTYGYGRMRASGKATHFSVTMKSKGSGPAKLGAIVLHYKAGADED